MRSQGAYCSVFLFRPAPRRFTRQRRRSLAANQSQNINLDPGVDGTTDLSLFVGPAGINSYIQVSGPSTTKFTNGLAPLNLGDPITLANTTSNSNYLMKSDPRNPTYTYPWAGVTNGASYFLGVSFQMSGESHLGWVELSMNKATPSLLVQGFAYNDVAGESVQAGSRAGTLIHRIVRHRRRGILALRRRRRAVLRCRNALRAESR